MPFRSNEVVCLTITTLDGKIQVPVDQSQGATTGVWSPSGKSVLFCTSSQNLYIYNLKTQRSQAVAQNVEGPLAWREDGTAYAGISVVKEKGQTHKELSRFDREGHIMGGIPLEELQIDPRYPLYWISQTDEVALFARTPKGANCYLTNSDQLRRVTTSDDLHG